MEENNFKGQREEPVYTIKMRAGRRRTYFLDVRETKGNDFYITITESKKRQDGGYDRHKIYLYKEDFNKFMESMNDVVNHVKTERMPEYDYDEFTKKQEEYDRMRAEQALNPQMDENGFSSEGNSSTNNDEDNSGRIIENSTSGNINTGNASDDVKLHEDKPTESNKPSSAPAGNDDDLKW
ncbi:hypothetical protein LBMAG27_02670 [Bacteroidota bacterium]|nr:hypothetical protein LBMAG27_02670 [Bacteroidota bacterium]